MTNMLAPQHIKQEAKGLRDKNYSFIEHSKYIYLHDLRI